MATIRVRHIPRAHVPQPSGEAEALENSLNYGNAPGRLVQVINALHDGFLLAIFEEE